MLLTRISIPSPLRTEPEDIFHSTLTWIFTDDTVNSHGMPGSHVTYSSPRFGDLKLYIPACPDIEDGRRLFAHSLWNAAVVAADAIESTSRSLEAQDGIALVSGDAQWNRKYFDVRHKTILELGAGTALPSLIAALSGASSCTITDHPSSPALTTGAIEKNIREANLSSRTETEVSVLGCTWGTSAFHLPSTYGTPTPQQSSEQRYDRIIAADCLWMPSQHINLISTILQFLRPSQTTLQKGTDSPDSELTEQGRNDDSTPCALIIAGFHTGRTIVSDFFDLATIPKPDNNPAPSRVPQTHEATHTHLPADRSPSTKESRPQDPNTNSHAEPLPTSNPRLNSSPSSSSTPSDSPTPNPAEDNTVPLNIDTLSSPERTFCGQLGLAEIFEVDVDGHRRPWAAVRQGEGKWEAKRWCVVGVLVRR